MTNRKLVDLEHAVNRVRLGTMVLGVIGLLVLAVRLLVESLGSEGILEPGNLAQLWFLLAVLVVGIGAAVAVTKSMSRANRQFHQEFQRFLAREHPHVPIIVGLQPRDLLARATAAGVSTDRIGHGGLVGLVVQQEGVAVWIPGDLEPRWRVPRVPGWVRVAPSDLPKQKWPAQSPDTVVHAIEVSDDERSASVVIQPEKADRKNPGRATVEAFAQALRALGEDPAEHIVMRQQAVRR
ncbi:hypothetical protein [Promicromonospora sp. NPDC060271]|uniref:hypothetical protein n=1 Tax=Promicromonospora sp. NPDC060271 TaxID=3347089 RepID=UPI0036647B63